MKTELWYLWLFAQTLARAAVVTGLAPVGLYFGAMRLARRLDVRLPAFVPIRKDRRA